MNSTEFQMFQSLIQNLEQARNLLCKPPTDSYAAMVTARFVDTSKKTLVKAREMLEESVPL